MTNTFSREFTASWTALLPALEPFSASIKMRSERTGSSLVPPPNDLDDEGDQHSSQSSDAEDSEEEIDLTRTPSRRKARAKEDNDLGNNIIVKSNFDAYFTYAASRPQTSTNVYSQLVLPLSIDEYSTGIKSASTRVKPPQPDLRRAVLYPRLSFQLRQGFNIICYGLGSKRELLNDFASSTCYKYGHVVVANGYQPTFTIADMLSKVEEIPDLEYHSVSVEKQADQVHAFFSDPEQKRRLYLVIHNIDAPPFRATRAKAILGLLAMNPRIHIIASVDHVNSSLLWSSSEVFSRKPSASAGASNTRGFSWLWHDVTTLAPYDVELTHADRSSISGANAGWRRKADLSATQNAAAMSESAAIHILASVNTKAKSLFVLLGTKQLESIESAGAANATDLQQHGMSYDALFNAARNDFIATSDTALKTILVEFRDHGLVLSRSDAGGEILWIPLRKERLEAVITSLQTGATS